MDNRCVICGKKEELPEGRQVCIRCERSSENGYGGRIFEMDAKPPGGGLAERMRRIMQWLRLTR